MSRAAAGAACPATACGFAAGAVARAPGPRRLASLPRAAWVGLAALGVSLASGTTTVQAQPRPGASNGPAAAPLQVEPWRIIDVPQATLVLARDGSTLGLVGGEKRLSVALASLPPYLGQAFVAVEDKRFYQHDGVDLVGVAAAIKDAATSGDVRGASTITQLLVGNMHPEIVDRRDRSISRKLREQQAARDMEKRYQKVQILEAFLNQIPFGRGLHGVELAARHYFGKPASALSLAEAASLAAMPKSPVQYDPIRYPDRNRERRNLVLALMRDQGYITPTEARSAQAEPLYTVPDAARVEAPWVVDVVRVQAERMGVPVQQGGYVIRTTIDPAAQRAAAAALRTGIADMEARPGWRHGPCTDAARRAQRCLEGAVVAIDPWTGDVRALVGGRDYASSSFNRAVDGNRQPGSAFKPFVYAAALGRGITAATPVADTALRVALPEGRTYSPTNADDQFLGALSLRDALARSRNPVAVELALAVGMDSVAALARRAGLRSSIAPFPSSALGASVVQPLNFVAAYAPFANGGSAVDTRFIDRIEDRSGRVVHTVRPAGLAPAMDPRVAFIVRDMLREAVERGTGTAARRAVPSAVPLAGKTGTSNDNADVWFVGLTPDLVAGAWLGFDTPRQIAPGAGGASLAAPIVGRLLGALPAQRPSSAWQPPAGVVAVELDRATGREADPHTPRDRRLPEWFLEGTEPAALAAWPWRLFRAGPIGP
jgi:1A family penicillin-binding protein